MTTSILNNNQLPIFKSPLTKGLEIRYLGTLDNPLFIAKDIAMMLGYKDTDKAIRNYVDNEDKTMWKQVGENKTFFRKFDIASAGLKIKENTIIINESGLYSLILMSKNKKTKLFNQTVTSKILPQIMKNGKSSS